MSTETSPPENLFDRLTEAMPRMAEAVNAFTLEDNQRVALQALLAAAGVPANSSAVAGAPASLSVVPPLPQEAPREVPDEIQPETTTDSEHAKPKRPRTTAAKRTYARVKDINFRPENKISLRDFVAQKAPTNQDEKNLVFVFYLEEHLEISGIEVGHVLSAYDEMGMKPPGIPDNSLMVTASRKRWLDTSDMKAIRTTHSGRNVVQHDMPIKKDKKSA